MKSTKVRLVIIKFKWTGGEHGSRSPQKSWDSLAEFILDLFHSQLPIGFVLNCRQCENVPFYYDRKIRFAHFLKSKKTIERRNGKERLFFHTLSQREYSNIIICSTFETRIQQSNRRRNYKLLFFFPKQLHNLSVISFSFCPFIIFSQRSDFL